MWGIWKERWPDQGCLKRHYTESASYLFDTDLIQLEITEPNLSPFSGNYIEFQVYNLYSNSFLKQAYFATYMFQLPLFLLNNTYFSLGMMWPHSLSFLRYFSEVLEFIHSLNFYWVLDVILGALYIPENRTEKDPCPEGGSKSIYIYRQVR